MRATGFIVISLIGAGFPAAIKSAPVTFESVERLAVIRAAAPFKPDGGEISPRLKKLTYEEYQTIKFRPDYAVWREEKLPFQLQFFPRGGLFFDRVVIHEVDAANERVIPFNQKYFDFGAIKDLGPLQPDLGYAGMRLLYTLNRPDAYDEVVAFLGASYFRAIGSGQRYGLSARGLTVDAVLPGKTEEFPRFTDFWVKEPEAGDKMATIYALLDGPSVTGAYEFVITPGKATFVDVRAKLIFRNAEKAAGFAPLTSMFWYGENSDRPAGEPRPEVHDSDGLMVMKDGASRIWKALHNPTRPETTLIPVEKLERFGLMQRDHDAANYQDLEAHYAQRPSAWIEPRDTWRAGVIHLVELPATREYGDNVVAYWVPAQRENGQPVELRYRIVWTLADAPGGGLACVAATREGILPYVERGRLFWVDFSDEKSASRTAGKIEATIEVGAGGRLRHHAVSRYPEIGGWRVAIEVDAERVGTPVELRCHLSEGREQISETWWYSWRP